MKDNSTTPHVHSSPMSALEKRAAQSIALLFSTRMLGMFMILPVFSLFAHTQYTQVSALMIGLAIGIYGLGQALFAVPFGMASDRFGRKPVIAFGLVLFALGSAMAATAESIEMIVLGRALQGMGAIASVLMALLADLTREEKRLSAMSIVGLTIGTSFTLSLMAGPLLYQWIGMSGIFWATGALAVLGIVLLFTWVPDPQVQTFHRDAQMSMKDLGLVLRSPDLWQMNAGIFILHLILTATFISIPVALLNTANLAIAEHWQVYLPMMLMSFVLMVPLIVVAEKKARLKEIFLLAVALIAAAQWAMGSVHLSGWVILAWMIVFFTAFNVLEASLPSMVAKFAPADKKGTAMGVYSSAQFLGAFAGGLLGGWVFDAFGLETVFQMCGVLAIVWWLWAQRMHKPAQLGTWMIKTGPLAEDQAMRVQAKILQSPGVFEAVWVKEDGIFYLKVDNRTVNKELLAHTATHEGESSDGTWSK